MNLEDLKTLNFVTKEVLNFTEDFDVHTNESQMTVTFKSPKDAEEFYTHLSGFDVDSYMHNSNSLDVYVNFENK